MESCHALSASKHTHGVCQATTLNKDNAVSGSKTPFPQLTYQAVNSSRHIEQMVLICDQIQVVFIKMWPSI